MNVMEIVSGHGVNGAVIHCLLLTRELTSRGHQVVLVCRHNAWIGEQLAQEDHVTVIESDLRRWPLVELRRIAAAAKAHEIDVLHTHMTRAHNFGVLLRRFSEIPCIATAHSHIIHPHWFLADHIIAVSEVTRRFHRSHNLIAAKKIDTVHGFVEMSRFLSVAAAARESMRVELGLNSDNILIGCVADILPRKGHLYLIRALAQLKARHPNARLALAGSVRDKSYDQLIREEAKRLQVEEMILWLGYRQDVPLLLAAFDLFVLPSLDEMFPVGVLEAMASALPIIATAVGGTPECAADPESLILIPPADPQQLAVAMDRLLSDPELRFKMAKQARETVQNHFTVNSLCPQVEQIFERVIERTQSKRKHPEGVRS